MPDPTAEPSLSPDPSPPAWLLGPADLDAIRADDALRDRLARGEQLDEKSVGGLLAAWLREVENGGTS